MAKYESHVTFSTVAGIAYGLVGMLMLDIYPEHCILALAMIVIAGILPDIDHKNGAVAKEVGTLISAVCPILILKFLPGIKAGGMTRIALVVIACYLFTRVFIVRLLQNITVERGMLHSIPAAIVIFEVVYLVFYDLYWTDRLYVATAAFAGFFFHLLLDASSNVDIVGSALGEGKKKTPALKFFGNDTPATVAVYLCMATLGWFVMKDMYPNLSVQTAVTY